MYYETRKYQTPPHDMCKRLPEFQDSMEYSVHCCGGLWICVSTSVHFIRPFHSLHKLSWKYHMDYEPVTLICQMRLRVIETERYAYLTTLSFAKIL